MHVHHVAGMSRKHLGLFTANGITGVRQMFGSRELLDCRKSVVAGSLLGPRMIVGSPIVDGPTPFWPGSISVSTAAQGREAVRTVREQGYDFVKVYFGLPREAYFAIADEAKKRGLPFVGHVPDSVGALAASNAGQKSIEHLDGLQLACSSSETELSRQMREAFQDPKTPDVPLFGRALVKAGETYDRQKAAALFATFVKNGTWQVPTLTVERWQSLLDSKEFVNDQRRKYLPAEVNEFWEKRTKEFLAIRTDEATAGVRKVFEKELDLVRAMHRAGVQFLAGTDSPNPYCFPGFSLHDELELLVHAGFTPLEALQAATRNPAVFLGKIEDFGTVERNKIADLVLLDANPLDDIRNTRKIAAVVVGGKLLSKESLQKMLDEIEVLEKK